MDSLTPAAAAQASAADPASVQGAASILVLKKAMNLQAASAAQLIESLPQPALAGSGAVGTKVNTYA